MMYTSTYLKIFSKNSQNCEDLTCLSLQLSSAPCSTRMRTTSVWPMYAAQWTARRSFLSKALMVAPFSSNSLAIYSLKQFDSLWFQTSEISKHLCLFWVTGSFFLNKMQEFDMYHAHIMSILKRKNIQNEPSVVNNSEH